jgi:hypothetical protein
MIYNVANTLDEGMPVDRVIAADGMVFDANLLEVDTDTGSITRWKQDEGGQLVIDDEQGIIVREQFFAVAPLVVIFKQQEE